MARSVSDKFTKFKDVYYPMLIDGEITKGEIRKAMNIDKKTVNNWIKRIEEEEPNGDMPFDFILAKKHEDVSEDPVIPKSYKESYKEPPKPEKEKKEKKEQDAKITMPKKEMLTAIDRSFATMVKAYASRQEWLSQVLEDIGMTTLFMALQLADIPPQQWYIKIGEFKDAGKFTEFVDTYLVALFEAKQDASRILELQEENNLLSAKAYYDEGQVALLQSKLKELINYLNAATSLLTKEQMHRLFMWNALYKMQNEEVVKLTTPITIENKEVDEDGN